VVRDHAPREVDVRITGKLDRHVVMHALGCGEIRRDRRIGMRPMARDGWLHVLRGGIA
jgi:hypothetical protein